MDFYSRMVTIFKVLLPLAALGILATLFLLSRGDDLTLAIPYAADDVAERIRGQQVTEPFFSGTTGSGDEIMVTASIANPGLDGAPAKATDLRARIDMSDGSRMTLEANTGHFDLVDDMATFEGAVEIATDSGFVVHTELLNTALSGVSGDSPGVISGTGPIGDFTAGEMAFAAKNEGGPVHMLFKNGVKLIYDPKQTD